MFLVITVVLLLFLVKLVFILGWFPIGYVNKRYSRVANDANWLLWFVSLSLSLSLYRAIVFLCLGLSKEMLLSAVKNFVSQQRKQSPLGGKRPSRRRESREDMATICVSEKCQPPLIARKGRREIKVSIAPGRGSRQDSKMITMYVFVDIDSDV